MFKHYQADAGFAVLGQYQPSAALIKAGIGRRAEKRHVSDDIPGLFSRHDGEIVRHFQRREESPGVIEVFHGIFAAINGMEQPAYPRGVFGAEKVYEAPFPEAVYTHPALPEGPS